jgi:tRNA(adenine34) deaminase
LVLKHKATYFCSIMEGLYSHEYFMQQALKQAKLAYEQDEVPVGAVVVSNNTIIARAHNQVELLKDPTAHAEILAITAACNELGAKYLQDAILYVTLEPCIMCAGAIHWSQIGSIVFGASDIKNGYAKNCLPNHPFNAKVQIVKGVLENDCAVLMKDFFKSKR